MSVLLRKQYSSIKKEKLSEQAKSVLKSMYETTNGFKDAKATRKIKPKFEAFYNKLKESKPEAIVGAKAKSKAAPKKSADEFKAARERRKPQTGVPKDKKAVDKDASRPAISKRGKRTSKAGNTYYEYRDNRLDKNPSKYPMLEKGGDISHKYYITYVNTKSGFDLYSTNGDENEDIFIGNYSKLEEAKKVAENKGLEYRPMYMRMAKGGYMDKGLGNEDLSKVDSVLWKNIEDNRYNVSALVIKYDEDTELRLLVIENGILLSNWINTKYFEKQPFSEGMYPRKKFNKQKIREEVINLLKENNLDSIKKEGLSSSSLKYLKKYAKGGYFAKGGYVAVSETKDGYWVVISRPTTKESAEEMADSLREDNRKVLNEETKVVTLEEAKAHKKIVGKEYLEKGGYMADGGELASGFSIDEMKEYLNDKFPYSFGFKVYPIKQGTTFTPDYEASILKGRSLNGLNSKDLDYKKLMFPKYKKSHDINYEVTQGGENTYFEFLLSDVDGNEYYSGTFGFKDQGDVDSDYITKFIAFLMESYGLPFKVNHSVYAKGGYMAHGGETNNFNQDDYSEGVVLEKSAKASNDNEVYDILNKKWRKYKIVNSRAFDLETPYNRGWIDEGITINVYLLKDTNNGKYYWDSDYLKARKGQNEYPTLADGGMMAHGGETHRLDSIFEDGGEIAQGNLEMAMSNVKAIEHHAMELKSLLDENPSIEAWVIAKLERAETDLSDVTHYIDGLQAESDTLVIIEEEFAKGGYMENGGETMKEAYVQQVVEIATKANQNGIKASDLTYEEFSNKVFEATNTSYGKDYLRGAYEVMKNKGYARGGELIPYIIWVSKDGEQREMFGEYKSKRAADMKMNKLWESGEYKTMGNKPKSMYEKEGFYADGGYMAEGGSIPNNYEGMHPREVWNAWSLEQKRHFLVDHNTHPYSQVGLKKKDREEIAEDFSYDDLPKNIQLVISDHIEDGQYAKGGMMAKGGEIADIEKAKKTLIAKAKSKGMYENFGQKEYTQLENKYGNTNAVRDFYNWTMNFDLSMMAKGGRLSRKQKQLDLNKNGKLDSQDFKMLRAGRKNARKK